LEADCGSKIPERLLDIVKAYEADPRPKVYIAVAGRSNALSGVLDCAVSICGYILTEIFTRLYFLGIFTSYILSSL